MAGVSVCATRSVVSAWEPNLRTYRVTYKVVMSDELDGPGKVLQYMATSGYVIRNKTYVYRYYFARNSKDNSASGRKPLEISTLRFETFFQFCR